MTRVNKLVIVSFTMLLTAVGLTVYHYHPYKIEHIGYTKKIWAHRVNSLEKLDYTQNKYTGIEVDIVYDTLTHTFDVTHPPTPSVGLNLETYLGKIHKPLGLWLDFKNLNTSNAKAALNRLQQITEKHNINEKHVIVESQHPKYLQQFEAIGFQTSYYLPSRLHTFPQEKLTIKIDEIQSNITLFPTTYISTNIEDYNVISTHFPEQKKLLWSLFTTYNKNIYANYQLTRKALKDNVVFVLLIRVNKDVGHR
mgnify:CR=1 FL=1